MTNRLLAPFSLPSFASRLVSWPATIAMTITIALMGCTTPKKPVPSAGIQNPEAAFARAKIAVLSCQSWPDIQSGTKPQVADEVITKLCAEFDRFVLDGFRGQPFMKGASPKGVVKKLKQSGGMPLLTKIYKTMPTADRPCPNCQNPIDYYNTRMAADPAFRQLVNDFSRRSAYADTILLPVIFAISEDKRDDRGLRIYARTAEVGIYLIDTNSGELVWYGGKKASADNRYFDPPAGDNPFPGWDILQDRLLVAGIWEEFPGRQ